MNPKAGVTVGDTSLAHSMGVKPTSVLTNIGAALNSWIAKGIVAGKDLLKAMIGGAGVIIDSIKKGSFFDLIKKMLKENPVAVAALAVAVILVAGVVAAVVAGGIAAVCTAIAGAGIGTQAALLAIAIPAVIQGAQAIDNFDWQQTDAKIEEELKNAFENLASVAGEAIGRAMAGLLIGKGKRASLQINMKATATLFLILEEQGKTDIQEEILEALVGLAWAAFRFARSAVFAKGYIQVIKWARTNFRTGIPSLDKAIASWGVEENKSFKISALRDNFVEAVQKENKVIGDFLENWLEGFGEGLSDFLIMEYSR